jgi:nicotinate phosphoribosyltransferase
MSPAAHLGLLANSGDLGLATDLYQLTMAAGYFIEGMAERPATFELFVRRMPDRRNFLLVAGLEQAVEYLTRLSFGPEAIAYLRRLPIFAQVPDDFFRYLERLRFRCDVDAVPEGTVAFPNEPLVRVRGPLLQAQLVETFLLATINHQTVIASKAARVVQAAQGRPVIDFGARRAHGFDAAIYGARAAVIGGCIGTSNVLAGARLGIDVYGTAAHSFTMAFAREIDAFRAFALLFPENSVLLIDTYDTLEGARRAAQVGAGLRGVRLDSGDLVELSKQVRRILDDAGLRQTRIVASGDLEEDRIQALLAQGAPIDIFGVGTEMITSRDAPALAGVYKLVEAEREGRACPVRKLSAEKSTLPCAKQIYRERAPDGTMIRDTISLAEERLPGEPLLGAVLRAGQPVAPLPTLTEIRERARTQLASLPEPLRRLDAAADFPICVSEALQRATTAWTVADG